MNNTNPSSDKIGILILNLGSPSSTDYQSVRRYLSEFLSDQRVIDYSKLFWQPILQGIILTSRPFRSGHAYKKIWNEELNESPLITYSRAISEKIAVKLADHHKGISVTYAMRYGEPSTKQGIKDLLAQGVDKILLFALYPQYSATTTASSYDKAFDYLKKVKHQPVVRTAPGWHDDSDYIDAIAKSIQDKLNSLDHQPEVILTSFHGLPKRYLLEGDPYYHFCNKTSDLVCEKLGWDKEKWITTFQSRFGFEQWFQPYTDKTIEELAKKNVKKMMILSPAFVCDCLETLEEIAMQGRDIFLDNGGETFTYVPCLNDGDDHINLLYKRVVRELQGWL
ncbi:MAG: ferrochelatase [SAR324 cluster bacterium]|nr:ferrochelatase [SAR324 cluster bacterium]